MSSKRPILVAPPPGKGKEETDAVIFASRDEALAAAETDELLLTYSVCPDCGDRLYYTGQDPPQVAVYHLLGRFVQRFRCYQCPRRETRYYTWRLQPVTA